MNNSDFKLITSNSLDTVSVDNTYRVINLQTSSCQIIMVHNDENIIISEFDISAQGMEGVQHAISLQDDTSYVLTVVFNENNLVLKNATIHLTATCVYNNEIVKVYTDLKYLPITKDEIIKLLPNVDIIKANSLFQYVPQYLNIKIKRIFDGVETLFDEYKDYRITYTFSDDLLNEYEYNSTSGFINCNNILNGKTYNRKPDYMLVNLYKGEFTNIPEQTIRIKIEREKYEAIRLAKFVLDNEHDTIITDDEYKVVSDTIITTNISCMIGDELCTILLDNFYPINVDITSMLEEESDFIENVEILTNLNEDGTLSLNLTCEKGAQIPKRMFINLTAYAQYYNNPNIISGTCTFTINASGTSTPIYQLLPNANAIRINKDGIRDPLIIGVNKYKWLGNEREITEYGIILYSLDASEPQLYTLPINTQDVLNNVLFEYYSPDMTLLAREQIYLVSDGLSSEDVNTTDYKEGNTYFHADDHSDNNGYLPPKDESEWSKNRYPDDYNEKKPYLWQYQEFIYSNEKTKINTAHYTTPTIVSIYQPNIEDVTNIVTKKCEEYQKTNAINFVRAVEYYYAGTATETEISFKLNDSETALLSAKFYVTYKTKDENGKDIWENVKDENGKDIKWLNLTAIPANKKYIELSEERPYLWKLTYFVYYNANVHDLKFSTNRAYVSLVGKFK